MTIKLYIAIINKFLLIIAIYSKIGKKDGEI